jgi:fucose permease
MILLATMAGYLTSSFAGGSLVGRLGIGRLLTGSGLLVAASALAWCLTPSFVLVVLGGCVAGLGAGAIDAAVNAYAARHFTPGTITWLHACWGLGAMVGPLVMTAAIAAGLGWRAGYAGLALALFALSAAFAATRALWDDAPAGAAESGLAPATIREAFASPPVRANALLFFVYAGSETSAGQWAYSLLTEARGLAPATAGLAASVYWGSIFAGRLAFGAIAHRVSPATLLRVSLTAAPMAAALVWLSRGPVGAFAGLFALGLVLAPIFPLLIAETPARVGERHAAHAIGFQVAAATLGAGTLPALAGILMRHAGLEALGPFLLAAAATLLVLHQARGVTRVTSRAPAGS